MITVTEVYRTLRFGHQGDARRDACNIAGITGSPPPSAQDSNEPLCCLTDSLELDQCLAALRLKSRLMNAKCLLDITMARNVQPNSVSFGFFQNVTMMRSMMNGHEVLVRASHFDNAR